MFTSFADVSPQMLGIFMLALACVPLIFVWQDSHRRKGEKRRLSELRREARLASQTWAGEARR